MTVSAARPSNAGKAANWNNQRQDASDTGHARATCESRRMPPFNAAPMTPAITGRDRPGQHSAAKATEFGQTPPTPSPTKNRSTSISSCVRTHAPSPANTE